MNETPALPYFNHEEETYTIRDISVILFRWWRLAAAAFILILIPALLVIFVMPPLYKATARIEVSRRNTTGEFSIKSGQPSFSSVYRTMDRTEEINTLSELIRKRTIAQTVIDRLDVTGKKLNHIRNFRRYVRAVFVGIKKGLKTAYNETKYFLRLARRPTPEELALVTRTNMVNDVIDRIQIQPVPDSTIVEVGFRSSDPLLAMNMINEIVTIFTSEHVEHRQTRARSFFAKEKEAMAARLRKLEQELDTLRNTTNSYAVKDQRKLLIAALVETQNEHKKTQTEKRTIETRIQTLEKLLTTEPEHITSRSDLDRNPALDAIDEQLLELELERTKKSKSYRQDSDVMRKLRAQIEDTRALRKNLFEKVEGSLTKELNPVYQTLRSELLDLKVDLDSVIVKEAGLAKTINAYRKELAGLGKDGLRIRELERAIKSNEEAYMVYVRNQEQARISENMIFARLADVRIVDMAALPLKPIRPRPKLYALISLVGALFLAFALPFFIHYNDHTLWSERRVGRFLGLSLVAAFPEIKKMKALPPTGQVTNGAPQKDPSNAALSEQAFEAPTNRAIERINLDLPNLKARIVTILGSVAGEGVSTVAWSIARHQAQNPRNRVLYIDANRHASDGNGSSREKTTPGLYTFLQAQDSLERVQQTTHLDNLKTLAIETFEAASRPEITSAQIDQGFQELREHFNYVFVDAAPGMVSPFSLLLAGHSDGTLLVTRSGATQRKVVSNVATQLQKQGAHLLGIVLSKNQRLVPFGRTSRTK